MVSIEQNVWGMTPEGEAIILYTLRNDKGAEVQLSNFGAAIVSVKMPDREGRMADVVLGYNHPEGYFFDGAASGKSVGRRANRIAPGGMKVVGQEDRRSVDERSGDGHTLLLAAGELAGAVVAAGRKAHQREQLIGTPPNLGTRPPADIARNADILEGRKFGKQGVELEDETDAFVAELRQGPVAERKGIGTVDLHTARIGTRKRADDLQQRRLACAAGSHNRNHFTRRHLERYAPEHLQ